MIKILNCKKCGSTGHISKQIRPIQSNQGSGYHKRSYDFYVICDKCSNMGKWIKSNSNKAIREWNKAQIN